MGNTESCCQKSDTVLLNQEYLKHVEEHVSHLATETIEQRYARYIKSFEPKIEQLDACMDAFVAELALGLMLHKQDPRKPIDMAKCNFKMLDAFCPKAPSGQESGIYYALDFGGTNFRVLRCEVKDGQVTTSVKKASLADATGDVANLPKGLLDPRATATQMFDFFANTAKELMVENGDINARVAFPMGFTFSFPCQLNTLDSANLMIWTKGFETGRDTSDPVENRDIAALMNAAFERNGVPIKCNCVANDTVGTLLSFAYTLPQELPPAAVGVILGTGMNACYRDDSAVEHGYEGPIINIECGNFTRCLPRTNIDYEIDYSDVAGRGSQHLEKMTSGAYIGELCRRTIVKILQYEATAPMWVVDSFSSGSAAACVVDTSSNLEGVASIVRKCWGVKLDHARLSMIQNVCEVIFRRAAALSAVFIGGCAIKTGRLDREGLSVGVDGSLFKCNKFFQDNIRRYLNELLGEDDAAKIVIVNADDGSGLGAAILSAVANA